MKNVSRKNIQLKVEETLQFFSLTLIWNSKTLALTEFRIILENVFM